MIKTALKLSFVFTVIYNGLNAQPTQSHNLHFDALATTWDEGIPLGNGMVGALIWQKEGKLRFSLDRADIWDLRPMAGLHRDEFSFKWVQQQVAKKDYKPVQNYLDGPYDQEPAPSKIPGGALEFEISPSEKVASVHLSLADAQSTVLWKSGLKLTTFVHAKEPVGWFRFENVTESFEPVLVAPQYQGAFDENALANSVEGNDLRRLGYKQGTIEKGNNSITYTQEGYGGFVYTITVQWKKPQKGMIEGNWSISSQYLDKPQQKTSAEYVASAWKRSYQADLNAHQNWWKQFWAKSAIRVPDATIEKQWYLEQYKFGSAARRGAPPISLQAVWTADNGRIPPWKGDFHHDLNTQLSYWPAYSGNHLDDALGYLDHLDENFENYKRYTKLYFGVDGLAVPGVTTLDGTEMGGWIQYSLSPTVSAWLAHHYYLQWRYSMDRELLAHRAYPWVSEVCKFLGNITEPDSNGLRKLPISSSPEINDNSLDAWFAENTNYDLALMKTVLSEGAELAIELGKMEEAEKWQSLLSEFGEFAITENHELMFAPSMAYNQSHRHFSHLMAIHPLGLIKWEDGPRAQTIIKNTIEQLDRVGPDYWCGYSYSWLANLKARAKDGVGAAKALSTFAKAFCLPNSFHVNGDQTKSGLSKYTYRPFTLEGNFAFAAGLQEMLLQSYAGFIEVLPAVPADWQNVSFEKLRAEGAFLVSAKKRDGELSWIKIWAEKDGVAVLKLDAADWKVESAHGVKENDSNEGFIELNCKAGGWAILSLSK
ncbi:glycosyl hydrolase family 65 [Dyadobacter jejuensis]|uniref:Glycosyl hydrolase family 65 n=1 Tax=Dyadobacter jejuensis TaxID=1082580 RepID=A0A316B224_9BACT|nr:glycoside hydrolase N-terminal domain-containing protein [Dyadobacter jejuensis]PWJ56627.1 glycosyl hydrolase family 65 [Dyadobacter jejuensis]